MKNILQTNTTFHDILYKQINLSDQFIELVQTKDMARLRDIALETAPAWLTNTGVNDSRFHHSLGVMHLAQIVTRRPEFSELQVNLPVAALAHDIASTPFSHAGERFLKRTKGVSHEQHVRYLLKGSEFADVAEEMGADMEVVYSLIEGTQPRFGKILAAEIDIDNMDNTLRYGLKAGLIHKAHYQPEELVRAYQLVNDEVALVVPDIQIIEQWNNCREDVYEYVYGDIHLAIVTFAQQAIHIAWQEGFLNEEFLTLGEHTAFDVLRRIKHPTVQLLIDTLSRGIFPVCIYDYQALESATELISKLDEPEERSNLAAQISKELKINPGHISVYTGKKRGARKINTPIYDLKGNRIDYSPKTNDQWIIKIFVHPEEIKHTRKVKEFMQRYVG